MDRSDHLRIDKLRQIAEESKVLAKTETGWQHRLARHASPRHASDTYHVAGVQGRVTERTECEESDR